MALRANVGRVSGALALALALQACGAQEPAGSLPAVVPGAHPAIMLGCERTSQYLPMLQGRRVAVVTNQTGMIGGTHLVDSLISLKVNVVKVFAPEHGFRGDADAGEHVVTALDQRTGLPLISLYGKNKKPTTEQLADVEVVVFDIQDVGVRFYTYISTLHYVMEACAEQGLKLIVLDRPNPNGFFVDGPVLDTAYASFVGMHPVPLVHGMTIGEYAGMINGEGWLKNKVRCDLSVIGCIGYSHDLHYALPVRPSPNLPNMGAVYMYPSLGLFEGTIVSVGRGTDHPFQCIGYPGCPVGSFRFTPRSMPGAKDPPYKDLECSGSDLREYGTFITRLEPGLHLHWLIGLYGSAKDKSAFFNNFFDKLAGGPGLREAILRGDDEERIRTSWQADLKTYKHVREKYLLYGDPY